MLIYLSLLLCIVGLIAFVAAKPTQPDLKEIGRITYALALLAFLLGWPHLVGVLGKN